MPEQEAIRCKIEITYRGTAVPEVKFFGDIVPNDIRFAKLFIQRQYHAWIMEQNRQAKQQQVANQLKEQEEAKKKEVEATKEQNKNEPGITEQVKTGSGNTETGSDGSRTDNGLESTGTVQAN